MNDQKFYQLLGQIHKYMETPKQFIENPVRIKDVKEALSTAQVLFPEAQIEIHDDPLQLGALILNIKMFDINLSGTEEITKFTSIIDKADNFEIYSCGTDSICFAAVFQGAYHKIS